MSKVKLLLDVISDIRALSESLQHMADAMLDNKLNKETETSEKNVSAKSEKSEKENAYSLEDVRSVLAKKSQKGFTAKIKTLLAKYGGNRLSDIDSKNYADIIKEAEMLGNE